MEKGLSRKLAVLLHADVVGSTALVQVNETLAHQRIQDTFRRFSETITSHGGTATEIRGDALVAEFSRASDAVSAAIAFQAQNIERNASLNDDIRPEIRVGISLGEVVIADGTVTGAGIVLAQRLEQLAKPNGVVVQGAVSEAVPTRLPFEFESLGEQSLKGFETPTRAFGVKLRHGESVPSPEPLTVSTPESVLTHDEGGQPSLDVPEEPSIAVLPFTNMSGDTDQEFFADGLTEDIITGLSSVRGLMVIARGSTFVYKGHNVDVKSVARELGVRFILEGSVRRSADRCRVNVELVEAEIGRPVWTQKYDRELTDLFELQDDIMQSVVASVTTQVIIKEGRRDRRQGRTDMRLWDLVSQATSLIYDFTPQSLEKALELGEEALSVYPGSDRANITVASVLHEQATLSYAEHREASLLRARNLAERALEIHEEDEWSHVKLAWILSEFGEHRNAVEEVERGLEINPNFSLLYAGLADLLPYVGRPEDAIEAAKRALRINPLDPANFFRFGALAIAYFCLSDYPTSIEWARKAVRRRNTWIDGHLLLIASLSEHGNSEDASSSVKNCLTFFPEITITSQAETFQPMRFPSPFRDRLIEALRQAGLPHH